MAPLTEKEDARVLLLAARGIHAERHGSRTFAAGTYLPLEAAGLRAGIKPTSFRYHDAIEELEYEGAIEWDTGARYARGDKHYVVTPRGMLDLAGFGKPPEGTRGDRRETRDKEASGVE
jgi:hypothetical protein